MHVIFGPQPRRRLQRHVAQFRAGRAEHLDGAFPAEIEPLAVELNALLDHNAEVIERARTPVGNLAHALKTPLAVLTNESAAPENDTLAEQVRRQTDLMRRHVDHYLVRARAAGAGRGLGRSEEGRGGKEGV